VKSDDVYASTLQCGEAVYIQKSGRDLSEPIATRLFHLLLG